VSEGQRSASDWAVFEAAIRAVHPRVRVLAYRLVPNPEDAAEALQEAYLRAFRGYPQFEGDRPRLEIWLSRIVYRTCVDFLRMERSRGRGVDPTGLDAIGVLAVVDRQMEGTGTRLAVESVLATLPPHERACLVLVDGLGFSYEDAAEVVGAPRGTVASRLHAGRRRFREAMGQVHSDVTSGEAASD
jgi:RNA polymerase sigma-70 factor, ECF subfamily